MKLSIRSRDPAWDAEYEVYADNRVAYRVKTSCEGNEHLIRILDLRGFEAARVYQDRYGVTGECRGRVLLTVERLVGLYNQMIPAIRSCCFEQCSFLCGDIKRPEYLLALDGGQICAYPSVNGISVRFIDCPDKPLEVLMLILAIEAIAQYT